LCQAGRSHTQVIVALRSELFQAGLGLADIVAALRLNLRQAVCHLADIVAALGLDLVQTILSRYYLALDGALRQTQCDEQKPLTDEGDVNQTAEHFGV
jgi:hypothetical protein